MTVLTRGARAATASTALATTAMASSHDSASMVVNMASVRLGRPEARTTRTASATISPTPSPTPSGVTEHATSTDMPNSFPAVSDVRPYAVASRARRPRTRRRPWSVTALSGRQQAERGDGQADPGGGEEDRAVARRQGLRQGTGAGFRAGAEAGNGRE